MSRAAAFALLLVVALAASPATRTHAQKFPKYQPEAPPAEEFPEEDLPPEEPPAIEEGDVPPEPEPEPQPEPEPEPEPAAEEPPPSAAADEPADSSAPAAEEDLISADAEPAIRALTLSFALGGGVGTLSFVRPAPTGKQRLPRAAFAAVGLSLRAHLWPKQALSLEALVDYRSSVGLTLRADPLFGLSQDVALRVQRVEMSFAPVLRLGTPERSPLLVIPVGFVLRTLVPETHQFGVPDLVLAGPLVRAELSWPLGEVASLRIGPELQWMLFVDETLTRQGSAGQGFALAGSAQLEARVSEAFSVAVSYRQAHAFVAGGERAYRDLERFAMALASGRW